MDLKKTYQSLKTSRKLYSIEVLQVQDGSIIINALQLKIQNGEIDIISRESGLDLKEYIKGLEKNSEVILSFTGQKVLVKKVETSDTFNQKRIFNQIAPNLNVENYYLTYTNGGNNGWACISKKDWIDDYLDQISEHKIFITGLLIGPANCLSLLDYFKNQTIRISVYDIYFSQTGLKDIHNEHLDQSEDYTIGDETIGSKHLIPLAGFLSEGSENIHHSENSIQKIAPIKLNYKYFQRFKRFGQITLATIFTILLINFLLFDYWNGKYAEIQTDLAGKEALIAKYDKLNTKVKLKEGIYDAFGKQNKLPLSFYADRLASIIPKGITLEEINLIPFTNRKFLKDKIHFEEETLLVKGSSGNSFVFNSWLQDIKQFDWVSEIEDINYEHTEQDAEFEIIINLSE